MLPAPASAAQSPASAPVGSVATVTGSVSDFRNGAPVTNLKAGDAIYKGDLLQTDEKGSLAVTFDDDTTFKLGPSSTLEVSDFLFEEGGTKNSALFNVVRGSTAFVASLVAKTGDMKIATPTATLGIRGTTGLVDVPTGAGAGDVSIKLYPDANGTVGRIEVFGAGGAQLGTLSRGSTGFSIRPGAAGRFAAVPLQIPPQQAARDRAFVRQTFSAQQVGRQLVIQRRQQTPGLQRQPRYSGPISPVSRTGPDSLIVKINRTGRDSQTNPGSPGDRVRPINRGSKARRGNPIGRGSRTRKVNRTGRGDRTRKDRQTDRAAPISRHAPIRASNQTRRPAFQATPAGQGTSFEQSYGASGDQSRAVVSGLPADIAAFSLEPDITRLTDEGLVDADWNAGANKGMVTDSVVVFVVRKGNPDGIKTWDDLVKPGVEVISPNPFISGGARWNVMAAYGSQIKAGKTEDEAKAYLEKLFHQIVVQPKSARDALNAFVEGKGDVMIGYENEAITAQQKGEEVDYVIPDETILIENPIAVVNTSKNAATAKAFVDFAISPAGQKLFAEKGYRPVDTTVAQEFADTYPTPSGLFTIADVGGWPEVMKTFFDKDAGIVAEINKNLGVPLEG